jgi:hypothetical protein
LRVALSGELSAAHRKFEDSEASSSHKESPWKDPDTAGVSGKDAPWKDVLSLGDELTPLSDEVNSLNDAGALHVASKAS